MKRLLKLILVLVVLVNFSCEEDSSLTVNTNDLNDLNHQIDDFENVLNKIGVFKNIKNKENFLVTKDGVLGKSFLQGEGIDQENNQVIFRVETKVKETRDGFTLSFMAASESCTGVNCAKCAFAQGGGCDCKETGSVMGGHHIVIIQ